MIYHVYATKSNLGDWLAARGIQSLLAPEPVTDLFCDGPCVEETLEVLSALTPDDFVIIGGGGLLMDYFEPFWRGFKAASVRAPFAIWGAGCCDLKKRDTNISKDLIAGIVRESRFCVVRDRLTMDFLNACGLQAPVACPSFWVLKPPALPGRGLLHASHAGIVDPATEEELRRVLKDLAERSGRVYTETRNRIEPKEKALQAELDKYRNADVVVSSRLHGCIIAAGMEKKLIAVSGDRKIDHFMAAAGLEDWVLDVNEIGRLPEMMKALDEQKPCAEFAARACRENLAVSEKIKKQIIEARRPAGLGCP